jgi:replication factor A1
MFMSAFDEVGNKILGKSASEMVRLKDSDYVAYQNAFKDSYFHLYTFKCKAKVESYNVSIQMLSVFCNEANLNGQCAFLYSRIQQEQSIQLSKQLQ